MAPKDQLDPSNLLGYRLIMDSWDEDTGQASSETSKLGSKIGKEAKLGSKIGKV